MGLFGSLIKATVKAVVLPVAVAADVLTSGAFCVSDNGLLTERVGKSLGKDVNKVSKHLDNI